MIGERTARPEKRTVNKHTEIIRAYGRSFLPHVNGSGLVDIESRVAPSVWVGKRSMVIGRSALDGNVRLAGDSRVADVRISTSVEQGATSTSEGGEVVIVDSLVEGGSIFCADGHKTTVTGSELRGVNLGEPVAINDTEYSKTLAS